MEKAEIIKRNLSGLPGNLALSYLSSKGCEGYGAMADWLHYAAKNNNIKEITVDVLNETTLPSEAKIPHLINPLPKLKEMISTNLKKHNIEASFITKAILRFEVDMDGRQVVCFSEIEDQGGKTYRGKKKITEQVNQDFNPKRK